jgi:hypothetical protein
MRFPTLQSFRVQIYREAQLDDLKEREENGFILFTEVECGIAAGVILALAVIYDLAPRLLAWMFG